MEIEITKEEAQALIDFIKDPCDLTSLQDGEDPFYDAVISAQHKIRKSLLLN